MADDDDDPPTEYDAADIHDNIGESSFHDSEMSGLNAEPSKPFSKAASKAPSKPSSNIASRTPSKAPSVAPSKEPSMANAPDSLVDSDYIPAHSRPASKPASKAPSVALSAEISGLSGDISQPRSGAPSASGRTPQPRTAAGSGATTPRPASHASGPGGTAEAAAASVIGSSKRNTPAGSVGCAGSPFQSDDFAEGAAGRERSSTSLPPGPSSIGGGSVRSGKSQQSRTPQQQQPAVSPWGSTSQAGSVAGSIAGSLGPASSRPMSAAAAAPPSGLSPGPSAPGSGYPSPAVGSRPLSILTGRNSQSGNSFGGGGSDGGRNSVGGRNSMGGGGGSAVGRNSVGDGGGGGSQSGFSLNGGLPPRDMVETPLPGRRGQFASTSGRASQSGAGGATRSSRFGAIQCNIPTPFELFRCYDADLNGRVTSEEFYYMLRDLDGLPKHYAPQDDPEQRLAELRKKCEGKQGKLDALKAKLELAEMGQQSVPEDYLADLRAQQSKLATEVSDLGAKIQEEEAAVRELAHHPDEAIQVTPEVRQHRTQWRRWVEEEFARADLGGNGILSVDEFYMYFYGKLCFRFPVLRTGVNPGALLFNIFVRYCSYGRGAVGGRNEDMLSHQFSKLCKDAGLINGTNVTKAALDIIYFRSRAADESLETYKHKAGVAATARMYYPQFLFALDKVAQKRRSGFQEVVAKILAAVDHFPEPTFSDFLILSGTELQPGAEVPEYLLRPPVLESNAENLRKMADNDLIKKMKQESLMVLKLSLGGMDPQNPAGSFKEFRKAQREAAAGAATGNAKEGFEDGTATVSGNPLAATTGAMSAAGSTHGGGVDGGGRGEGAFASTAPAGSLGSGPRPGASGPAGGGAGGSVYGSLAPPSLTPEMLRRREWERPEPAQLVESRATAMKKGMAVVNSPNTMHAVRGMDPDTLMASLKRVFEAYARWGGGVDRSALDNRRFSKALRDALLVSESGPLPARKAEIVYGKILPRSCKALNFIQFIEALRHVAIIHRLALNEVMERLVAVGGPQRGA